jgi:hypothetical protein
MTLLSVTLHEHINDLLFRDLVNSIQRKKQIQIVVSYKQLLFQFSTIQLWPHTVANHFFNATVI